MKNRKLNDAEIEAINKMYMKNDSKGNSRLSKDMRDIVQVKGTLGAVSISDLRVRYLNRRIGFTVCIIQAGNYPQVFIGVSHRSYKDKPNQMRGNMVAFIRAITNPAITVGG